MVRTKIKGKKKKCEHSGKKETSNG